MDEGNPRDHGTVESSSKIVGLDIIGNVLEAARDGGRQVVHCHGVFDLLHVGHLRHIRKARSFGDILVVSITTDTYVNKGPGRPAFPESLRAEMLAAFDCVDYVTVVHAPSAEPAINAIRPDVYVKGGEYDNPDDDITGNISLEQQQVESHGGRVEFTYDLTFSSSNLINSFLSIIDENVRAYLKTVRQNDIERTINVALDRIADLKIVIIGETIIDHYIYVSAMGKAAKENIIATLHQGEEYFAGGVIAAANHLTAFCPNVEVMTILGDPECGENFESFVRERLTTGLEPAIYYRPEAPTIQKTRYVDPTYVRKMFEVYRMDDQPLPADVQSAFHADLREKLSTADMVIVNDFGHGFINRATVDVLVQHSKFLAVNVQTNAGNLGYNLLTKYSQADYLCIDAMEARLVSQDKHLPLEKIVEDALPKAISCPLIVVTHGKSGCFAIDGERRDVLHIPAFRGDVVDTVGAGDAFFAVSAPFAALGMGCEVVGFMGNVAGAMKVGVVGHRESIRKLALQRYITTLLK